jgi:hypothetical protein
LRPEEFQGSLASHLEAPEMGHVEDACVGSHGLVLVEDAVVMHGHGPATEIGETGPGFIMDRVERRG